MLLNDFATHRKHWPDDKNRGSRRLEFVLGVASLLVMRTKCGSTSYCVDLDLVLVPGFRKSRRCYSRLLHDFSR